MQKGDTVRTMTGKLGEVLGIYDATWPGGVRVKVRITARIDGDVPITIRAAYDPRDLEVVNAAAHLVD